MNDGATVCLDAELWAEIDRLDRVIVAAADTVREIDAAGIDLSDVLLILEEGIRARVR